MDRRDLLIQSAVVAGGAATESAIAEACSIREQEAFPIIDTNVSLFHWPFRRLPLDQADALTEKLDRLEVTKAWASSFEGVLHRDIAAVNDRLVDTCNQYPSLVPIGVINPALPDWQRDLARVIGHQMIGIRLYPNYHRYGLGDVATAELLEQAAESELLVQVCVAMEDQRTQHPLVRVPDVNLKPLAESITKAPGVRVQVLNATLSAIRLSGLTELPHVYFDVSRVDSTDGIAQLMKLTNRVCFGSHSPFLIPEAALIRTGESGLAPGDLRGILHQNAESLQQI